MTINWVSLLLLLVIWIIIQYFIMISVKMFFYTKQGFVRQFIPLFGFYAKCVGDSFEKGDFWYTLKKIAKENPKSRGVVSNFHSHVMLYITCPKLLKEFYGVKQVNYIKSVEFLGLFKDIIGNGLI